MPKFRPDIAAVTALVREKGDNVDEVLWTAASALQDLGLSVSGVVQKAKPGRAECCQDFGLCNLATGKTQPISQDLGSGARGCRLDYGNLAEVIAEIESGMSEATDALILNRFGYSETQGGGFRPLIELAVSLEIPVLLSVNRAHHGAWQDYAGSFSDDKPASPEAAERWCAAFTEMNVQAMFGT